MTEQLVGIDPVAGRLTPYGFACGNTEVRVVPNNGSGRTLRTTMWEEHGCYHVRQHEGGDEGRGRIFWDTFTDDDGDGSHFASAVARLDACVGRLTYLGGIKQEVD